MRKSLSHHTTLKMGINLIRKMKIQIIMRMIKKIKLHILKTTYNADIINLKNLLVKNIRIHKTLQNQVKNSMNSKATFSKIKKIRKRIKIPGEEKKKKILKFMKYHSKKLMKHFCFMKKL
jgi:hypothetical protein